MPALTHSAFPARPAVNLHPLALAAAIALAPGWVIAADADPAPTTELDKVEIRATPVNGSRISKSKVPAPVQTLSGEDMQRRGNLSLGDALQSLGSVHINEMQGNPFQPDVNYRGFTASPLLGTPQGLSLYVDGVRQNQPFGDTVSWDLTPRSAIAEVSLMPGSNPLFGLNTLGGALSVTTKDGRTAPGGSLMLSRGSHGRWMGELSYGGANDEGWDWFGTGTVFKEEGWRDASRSAVGQVFGKLGWRDGVSRVSLSVSHAENTLRGNGLQEQQLLDRDWSSVYTKPDETRNLGSSVTLQFERELNSQLKASGHAYWRQVRTSTYNGDINEGSLDQSVYTLSAADRAALTSAGIAYPSTAITAANTPFPYLRCIAQALQNDEPGEKCNGLINRTVSNQQSEGLAGQLSWTAPLAGRANLLVAGASWDGSRTSFRQSTQLGYINSDRSITGINAYADGVTGGDVDGEPFDNRVDLRSLTRTASLYATDTLSITPQLHLTVSGRYNRTRVLNTDRIHTDGGDASLDGDHRFHRFNPALGLSWQATRSLTAYGSWSQGSRAPTSIELGCANPERPCRLPNAMAGDPPLDQVVTQTAELGVRGRWDARTEWNLGVFRADNRRDILFVADDQAGYGYFKNFGRTRRQGLEAGVITRQAAWSFSANYTWLDATFRSEEIVNGTGNSTNSEGAGMEGTIQIRSGDRMPLIPRHQLKLAMGWKASPTWDLELSGIGVSGSYARGNENNAHQPDGSTYLGSGRSAGYAVFNLATQWQTTSRLKVFGHVANLFDRRYTTAAQLGNTAFTSSGAFQARPFGGSAAAGYPLQGSTFYAPGAPRSITVGLKYDFATL